MRKKAEQARGSSRPVINVPWCYLLQVLLSNSSRFAPVMDGTKPTNPVLSKVVLAGVLSQRQKVNPNIFILHSFMAPDQLAWKCEDTSVCHTLTALPISEEPTLGTSNRCEHMKLRERRTDIESSPSPEGNKEQIERMPEKTKVKTRVGPRSSTPCILQNAPDYEAVPLGHSARGA